MKVNHACVLVMSPVLALAASAQTCQPHWEAWGGGVNSGAIVDHFASRIEGGAPVLYASGEFTSAGGQPFNRIARWNGTAWSALGSGITGNPPPLSISPNITSMAFYNDPGGEHLFAGGWFAMAGGQTANGVARWDGAAWSTFGAGLATGSPPQINDMTVFDDGRGGGPSLYVCGLFGSVAGVPAAGIARWNGTAWTSLAGATGTPYPWALALKVFDNGSGPALYVGGHFTSIGGISAARIARWDGVSWSAVGAGFDDADVNALAVYDDGTGPALYACGSMSTSGGTAVNGIARLSGASWLPLGSGLQPNPFPYAENMAAFDDGSGPALYIGGQFSGGGGVASPGLVRWRRGTWESVGGGVSGGASPGVYAMTVFDDGLGGGPALYVGGPFSTAGTTPAAGLARWTSCPCYANCDASSTPPVLNVLDFVCFLNRFASGNSYANCDQSTTPPVLNVNDFNCFINRFVAGCP